MLDTWLVRIFLAVGLFLCVATPSIGHSQEKDEKHVTKADGEKILTLDLSKPFKTKTSQTFEVYQRPPDDSDDLNPYTICFLRKSNAYCTEISYNQNITAEIVPLASGESGPIGLVLTASNFTGGSGVPIVTKVWVYASDEKADYFQEIFSRSVNTLGGIQIFGRGVLAGDIVVTNFIWESDETHFDPHHFSVNVYRLFRKNDLFGKPNLSYEQILQYRTKRKYTADDDTLTKEEARIKRNLKLLYH